MAHYCHDMLATHPFFHLSECIDPKAQDKRPSAVATPVNCHDDQLS
jgi:hypothetical protein